MAGMQEVEYREVAAKSALNRSKSQHSAWTLNPYRGCVHACRYCYARATHAYLDLGPGEDFERVVVAKTNLPDVLCAELRRRRRPDSVIIGTAGDPYLPAESKYRITRGALEALADRAVPCAVITKGTLVVRDRDVLRRLAERADARVLFSLSTVDPALARVLEPGAPSPASRLRALALLRDAGVPANVLLCPVIPGLTDAPEQVLAAARAARAAGANDFAVGALRLAPTIREHFLAFLDREHPALLPMYERLYRFGSDPDRAYAEGLARRAAAARAAAGFAAPPEERRFPPPAEPEQLSFLSGLA